MPTPTTLLADLLAELAQPKPDMLRARDLLGRLDVQIIRTGTLPQVADTGKVGAARYQVGK